MDTITAAELRWFEADARKLNGRSTPYSNGFARAANTIERLERELAENIAARNDFAKDWDAAHNRAEAVESELATLRARVAKMEEALRAFGFGSDRGNERVGWHGRVPPPSTSAHFRCEFCHREHLDCTEIQHTEGCPVHVARDAILSLTEEPKP